MTFSSRRKQLQKNLDFKNSIAHLCTLMIEGYFLILLNPVYEKCLLRTFTIAQCVYVYAHHPWLKEIVCS